MFQGQLMKYTNKMESDISKVIHPCITNNSYILKVWQNSEGYMYIS